MAAIYVKVNGRYVAIPTLKGDTSDVSNDIISDAQSIVLPPSVKAIKDYVDDELDDALVSAINSGDLVIAFNKYSDLPETGHYAYVRTNETTSQTGSVELVEGNQYTLYLNPAPNYDVDIYGFDITGAAGFDDNKYSVSSGTAPYRILITAHKGTETHIWQYGEYGYYSELGWWYLVNEFGSTKSAVKIDYSELPVLSGTVSHGGGATYLGFPFASETPYSTKNYGLYRYDENLEQWVWTDSGYFENREVLGLFATTNGELTFDGEEIGYKFPNAEVLAQFSEVNDQPYFDGMQISGVNVAKYTTVDELDTNEDLIIAQVTTTQESWRSARRKQDATFTFVEVPKMPIEDFTANVYKNGELFGTMTFYANNPFIEEEGIGLFLINDIGAELQYCYAEHDWTLTGSEFTGEAGWVKVVFEVVDGEIVGVSEIIKLGETGFLALPHFNEIMITATNGALTGLQEFITTDTANNEKTALRWIREEGIYIVNTDGDWRKYTSSYIADDYNRLPDDAPIGSTAITLADVEQDKEPEQFETGVTYDYWYFRREPVIPELTIYAFFDCNYNGIAYTSYLRAGATALSTGEVSGGTSGFYVQLTYSDEIYYKYYIIYTAEGFTATIEGETIALSAGWNGVRADYADDVWTLTDLNFTFETLPIFSDCYIEPLDNTMWADYLDGFFSATPYITRKAGGYTKLESGWEETVCIDPLVEVKANKVATIDANSTDEEYPSAKAVFNFVPEIDVDELVPTMTEYDADDGLTLNKGNYWTTTASIEFGLPTPVSGKVNTFDLFVKVANSAHIVTFSAVVEWAGSVAYVFGEGTHKVCGEYDPINSKWLLTATAAGVPA
jgi:hypothetical protein